MDSKPGREQCLKLRKVYTSTVPTGDPLGVLEKMYKYLLDL